jgi:hypothetical protein
MGAQGCDSVQASNVVCLAQPPLPARVCRTAPLHNTVLCIVALQGAVAFQMFQLEMRTLLDEMKQRGQPNPEDQDISAQLFRVMSENPNICENRILSEIGMLFVEGFETTGGPTFKRSSSFHTSLGCLVHCPSGIEAPV